MIIPNTSQILYMERDGGALNFSEHQKCGHKISCIDIFNFSKRQFLRFSIHGQNFSHSRAENLDS